MVGVLQFVVSTFWMMTIFILRIMSYLKGVFVKFVPLFNSWEIKRPLVKGDMELCVQVHGQVRVFIPIKFYPINFLVRPD